MTTTLLAVIITDAPSPQPRPGPKSLQDLYKLVVGDASHGNVIDLTDTLSTEQLSNVVSLPGATEMAKAAEIADICGVTDLANEQDTEVIPAQPSLLGGPLMEKQPGQLSSSDDVFVRNPERWLRDVHPDWSEDRIQQDLLRIYVISLQEFYDRAIAVHPELEKIAPIFPADPPKLLRQLGRWHEV